MALCTVKVRTPVEMECYFHIAVGHKVYSFGGTEQDGLLQSYLNVHVFNTVSLKWTQVFPRHDTYGKDNREVPRMRWSYSGVLIDNVIYIWGGTEYLRHSDNVLYAFDVDTHTWINTEVSGTVPEWRSHHSACVLGKVMYIHGGCVDGGYTNDVYKLDTSTMVWSLIETGGTAPPVSFSHSATIIGTKMFVFGGLWGKANYRDIRVFDTETNLWLSTPSAQLLPLGRYSPSAFAYNGELYICGTDTGEDLGPGYENMNGLPMTVRHLWKINPETLSWKKVQLKGSGPFAMYEDGCCVVGDRIVIFGYDERNYMPDDVTVYIFDFSPSLKTLCKLAVRWYGLEQSELPHDLKEELAAGRRRRRRRTTTTTTTAKTEESTLDNTIDTQGAEGGLPRGADAVTGVMESARDRLPKGQTLQCRMPGCTKMYKYSMAREHHEKKLHGLTPPPPVAAPDPVNQRELEAGSRL